jgi:hypothetical protein
MRQLKFKVLNIVVQDASNIYLVMNKLGLLKVSIDGRLNYTIE